MQLYKSILIKEIPDKSIWCFRTKVTAIHIYNLLVSHTSVALILDCMSSWHLLRILMNCWSTVEHLDCISRTTDMSWWLMILLSDFFRLYIDLILIIISLASFVLISFMIFIFLSWSSFSYSSWFSFFKCFKCFCESWSCFYFLLWWLQIDYLSAL